MRTYPKPPPLRRVGPSHRRRGTQERLASLVASERPFDPENQRSRWAKPHHFAVNSEDDDGEGLCERITADAPLIGSRPWYEFVTADESGWIYQADIWCSECGEAICAGLKAEGSAPEDPDDEYSYDSDDYPKAVLFTQEETDSPAHCAALGDCRQAVELPDGSKIGIPLDEALTDEGVEYLKEMLSNERSRYQHFLHQLWCHLYRSYLG